MTRYTCSPKPPAYLPGFTEDLRRCGVVWTALQVQQARSVSGPCTLACRPRTLSRPTPPGEGCPAPVPWPLPCFGLAPPASALDRERPGTASRTSFGGILFRRSRRQRPCSCAWPRPRALDPAPPHCPRNRGKPRNDATLWDAPNREGKPWAGENPQRSVTHHEPRQAGGPRVNAANRPLGLVHRFSRRLAQLYFGVLCRVRVDDMAIPDSGCVISMNHRSALDMFLYWAIIPRRIKFLAKKELFSYPLLGPLLVRWCIPVDRGRYDRRALDFCIDALRDGYVLSVFPEGTRHAQLAAGHGGAVLMAAKASVPVLPGAIIGRYGPFQSLTVRFGTPMRLPPNLNKQQRDEATQELMEAIRSLGAKPAVPPAGRGRWRWRERLRRLRSRRSPEQGSRSRAV